MNQEFQNLHNDALYDDIAEAIDDLRGVSIRERNEKLKKKLAKIEREHGVSLGDNELRFIAEYSKDN